MFEILLDKSFLKDRCIFPVLSDLYMLFLPVWVYKLIKSPTSLSQAKQSNNAAVLTGCIQVISISLSKKLEFKKKETITILIME